MRARLLTVLLMFAVLHGVGACSAMKASDAAGQTEQQVGAVNLQADLETAVAKIGELEMRIGGGSGDTVSMWLLIAGAYGSGILYPILWKPIIRGIRNGKKT